MGKFSGVLFYTDYDDTLYNTAHTVSPENRAAIHYFIQNGGRFSVATGRAHRTFTPQIAREQLELNAPVVLSNGAMLYDYQADRCLVETHLDGAAPERLLQLCRVFPDLAVEAYHVGNVIHAVHPNDITRHHEHITHVGVTEAPSLLEVPVPLGKLMFEGEHGELETIRDWFAAQGWAGEYELIFSDPTLLEMTALGANKGAMVLRLAERLGVSREHVYCAGDESNDLSMLAVAAEGFAPANCAPAVRESGATIVSDAAHDALADIIAILDKRYS